MVLIFSHITSPRLQYICSFIFNDLLGVQFNSTIDSEEFRNYQGAKINYSPAAIAEHGFWIKNSELLFEEIIIPQHIECVEIDNTKVIFKTPSSFKTDLSFDIFAASFYLMTRYEEYLPHEKDLYGRYAHENSLAYKENFLHLPLINHWVTQFGEKLKIKFPGVKFKKTAFQFLPTYDIDMAWSFKHKGVLRNIGGFLKKPSLERLNVLLGLKKDPFDSYDWLDKLHEKLKIKPLYFFLVAEQIGRYDKNILPHKEAMWKLVKRHAKKYTIGLHPSWQSGDRHSLIKKEKEQLEAMCENGTEQDNNNASIINSRQHFIRFQFPQTYQQLIAAGIIADYSMGYGSINGFRASVASPYYWYDLEKEEQTQLKIHPFCFMDANSFYEKKETAQQAFEEMIHYYDQCKLSGGTLITIWHNNFLGTAKPFNDWKEKYEQFIALVQQ